MNRFTAIALFTLTCLVTAGTIVAQDREVRANVPFDFTVGNQMLPAGSYTMYVSSPDQLLIRNKDQHQITVLSRTSSETPDGYTDARLVFNKYGSQYFLREVEASSVAMNVELGRSRSEKKAQVQEAKLNNSKGTQTFIALNTK